MRPLFALATVAAALLTSAVAPAVWAQAPAGQVAVLLEPPVADFGTIEPSSSHVGKFTLKNLGSAPATVKAAVPTCKCTSFTDLVGKVIPARGELAFEATLKAPASPGEKDAKLQIVVEGMPRPLVATLKGLVTLPVSAEPPFVDALKDVVRGTVKLRSIDGQPFRILKSGDAAPVFRGFDPAKDAPRAEYEIVWDLSGRGCDTMPLWWTVFTDRADCPVVPLRVRDECTGSKADPGRHDRAWMFKEPLVQAPLLSVGKPTELAIEIEHYNPQGRGRIDRPRFREVQAVRDPSGLFAIELLEAKPVGTDEALVRIRVTPTPAAAGERYLPLTVTTATGAGQVAVAARTVAP
jgi:hypothetical protein